MPQENKKLPQLPEAIERELKSYKQKLDGNEIDSVTRARTERLAKGIIELYEREGFDTIVYSEWLKRYSSEKS